MPLTNFAFTLILVLLIGAGALYKADSNREIHKERDLAGVPLRLISLFLISYSSVILLAIILNAPETFGATNLTFMKMIGISSIFSEIGAITADSLL